MSKPLKILFKYPCRGRKDLFFASLDSLNDNIRDRNNYHVSLTLDTDDDILNIPEVIGKIDTYENVSISWGLSKSKIDAINRGMPNYEFDIIICWSMDMVAVMYGFDDIMREYLYQIINNNDDDFLAHFPEKDSMEHLNVLYIATKKYYERFNYIYHPSYISLWCDNETYSVAKILNRYHYIGILGLYEHRNMAYHHYGIERDELFNHQQSFWGVDEKNFNERKAINFDLPITEKV